MWQSSRIAICANSTAFNAPVRAILVKILPWRLVWKNYSRKTFQLHILLPSCTADHICTVLYTIIMPPTIAKGAISIAFVRPSVCLSVCPSVAYTANNSRTQRSSVPKFGRKVSHLRCDSHTRFKVKQSKVSVGSGRGHTMSAKPGSRTACYTRIVN